MKKISFVLVFILSFAVTVRSQDSSSHLRISILTCAQGEEVYTIFGHTALRIVDSARHTDLVYNYGTFDFNDPDFYTKFLRGRLDYFLSVDAFVDFMYEYQSDKRQVIEQELRLPDSSRSAIARLLKENLLSSARFYKYDFSYNNCTSRIRDLLMTYADLRADQKLVPAKTSFRDELHVYLDNAAAPWIKLGIDILLGRPVDKHVNKTESMFLPDYLMMGIDSSVHSSNGGILLRKTVLNNGVLPGEKNYNWPLFVFGLFAIVVIGLSFSKNKSAKNVVRIVDFILFFLLGLTGLLLVCLWFGSDRDSYRYNYNLLWALPTHAVAAFALWKKPRWLQNYFSVCAVIYLVTLLFWFWLPQQLNVGLIPLVVLLLQRCLQLRKR